MISGDFVKRQFDEFKFDALQIWRKLQFGKINLMKSTIWWKKFDEKYNLAKKIWRKVQFGEKNLIKSTIWLNIFDEGQLDEIYEIV